MHRNDFKTKTDAKNCRLQPSDSCEAKALLSVPLSNGAMNMLIPDDRSSQLDWSMLLTSHLHDDVIAAKTRH